MNTPRKRRPAGQRAMLVQATAQGAFEEGCSEVESLFEEINEWKENLESNSMEHLDKYSEVSECAEYLETAREMCDLEFPEFLSDLPVTYTQDTRISSQSRSTRLSNADNALSVVLDACNEWLEENEELVADDLEDEDIEDDVRITEEMVDERGEQRGTVEEFIQELESKLDEARNACFPGMY